MSKHVDDKDLEKIITSPPEEAKKDIESWQGEELDASSHVKYKPNERDSKSHLDAILADVNDPQKTVEQSLNKDFMKGELLKGFAGFGSSGDISSADISGNDLPKSERKFKAEEKRKKEMLNHQDDAKGK